MHLKEVEHHHPQSAWGHALQAMSAAGIPVPKILARFTQEVMRGPDLGRCCRASAAFTSRVNNCDF